MKKNLSIILALFLSLNTYSQCSSVRGGNVKFIAIDTTTGNQPTIWSYTFTVYYDATNFCGDTVFFSKQYASSRTLNPVNGINGALINPYTRMCIYTTKDTLVVYGLQNPTFKAGYYISGIANIPNSSTTNFIMSPFLFTSANSGVINNKSVLFQGTSADTNAIGNNYSYNPYPVNLDGDSTVYSISLCTSGATNPPTSSTYSINPNTGVLAWNTPTTADLYNIRIAENDFYIGNPFALGYQSNNGEVFSEIQILTKAGTTGINLFEVKTTPFVFPNPSSNKIHIVNNNNLPTGVSCEIKIKDITGKEVKSLYTLFNSEIIVDVNNLSSGEYFYEIIDGNNSILQKDKFIKQ